MKRLGSSRSRRDDRFPWAKNCDHAYQDQGAAIGVDSTFDRVAIGKFETAFLDVGRWPTLSGVGGPLATASLSAMIDTDNVQSTRAS